jgi:recombination protein RecR
VYEGVVQDLIDELGRLPGIGPKSAQRIAFHVLQTDPADVRRLVDALSTVVEKVRFCAREFRGRYHVLGGAISPIEGVGPDDLRVKELVTRLASGEVMEIIIATDPNLEGEATATYLARLLKPMGLRVTRLASGLPVGGDLEYADELTLGRAFEGRRLLDV